MSSTPSAALHACSILDACTDLPHLLHMSSHITLQLGDYPAVVASNLAAIAADEKHIAAFAGSSTKNTGFFVGYMTHDYHMAVYGACLGGYKKVALDVASSLLLDLLPLPRLVSNPPMLMGQETFLGLSLSVFIRFGMWEEVVASTAGEVDSSLAVFRCDRTASRAVALANLGRVAEARTAFEAIAPLLKEVEGMARFKHNNTAFAVLTVEAARAEAEVLFFENKRGQAWDAFERAVRLDDGLAYDEPWGVLVPTRHSFAGERGNYCGELGRSM